MAAAAAAAAAQRQKQQQQQQQKEQHQKEQPSSRVAACRSAIGPIGRRELAESPFNFDRFLAWTGYFSPQNSSPAARL